MRSFKWLLFWLAFVAVVGVVLWRVAIQWRPPVSQYAVQGMLVSAESGAIHWPSAHADGADFAWLVATAGDEGRDPRFEAHLAGAREAGVRTGAAHIWNPCRLADDQATNFIATVPADPQALPPALILDLEGDCAGRPSRDVLLSELARFLGLIERHSEKPAILHVTRSFDEAYAVTGAIDRPLWLARRLFPPDYGARPWVMWQASDIRRVGGVERPARWSVVRP